MNAPAATVEVLDRDAVERFLPHRGLMLLVDRVLAVDAKRVVGEMDVQPDAFWAAGHFPGAPVLPGVLQVELAAQLGGVLLAHLDGPARPGDLGVFASVRRTSFRRPVLPPSVLRGEVTLVEHSPAAAGFRFSLTVGRDVVADGQLTLAFARLG